jgi:hypothetical protein
MENMAHQDATRSLWGNPQHFLNAWWCHMDFSGKRENPRLNVYITMENHHAIYG